MLEKTWVLPTALGLLLSCADRAPATQVLVLVNSDLDLEELKRIEIRVLEPETTASDFPRSQGRFELGSSAEARSEAAVHALPLSFGIAPPDGSTSGRFRLVVTGQNAQGETSVEQHVIASFRKEQTLLLEVFLPSACLDLLCRAEQTDGEDVACRADAGAVGRCLPIEELGSLRR